MRMRAEIFLSSSLAVLLAAIAISLAFRGPGRQTGPLRKAERLRDVPKLLPAVGRASGPSEEPKTVASVPPQDDKATAEAGALRGPFRYAHSEFLARVTSGGWPVEGAEVEACLWEPEEAPFLVPMTAIFDPVGGARSGADGIARATISYWEKTSAQAPVGVFAYHPGVGLGFSECTLGDLLAAGPGELQVELESGRSVRGRVLGPDGTPIEGARVEVSIRGSEWRRAVPSLPALTGKDGTFEVRGILSDDYPVQVSALYGRMSEPMPNPKVFHPGLPPTPEEIRMLLGHEWIVGPFDGTKLIAKEMLDAESGVWDVGDIHLTEVHPAIDVSAVEEPPVEGERGGEGN